MKSNFLCNIFAIAILLFGISLTAHAQKNVDLKVSIVSPVNGEVIPFGDTVFLKISVKNLGPDTLFVNSDSIYFQFTGFPFANFNWANIAPLDSVIFDLGYEFNDDSTEYNGYDCVYLLPSYTSSYVDTNQLNDTSCVSYTLAGYNNVGISNNDANSKKHFDISPNPANQTLYLNFSLGYAQPIIILVRDLLGRDLIYKDLGVLSGNQKQQLDISSFNSGMYIVELRVGNQQWIQKLIIN